MSELRKIKVHGPRTVNEDQKLLGPPLWTLDGDLLYKGSGSADDLLVDHNTALRSLALGRQTQELAIRDGKIDVNPPALLHARLDLREIPQRWPEIGVNGGEIRDGHTGKPISSDVEDLVLAVFEDWPDPARVRTGYEITVPDFTLAAGGIPLRVTPKSGGPPKKTPFANFLHYDFARYGHTVLFRIPLLDDEANEGSGPLVRLVPEGIELNVKMPHPLADMVDGIATDAKISATIRIEPGPRHNTYQARLVTLLSPDDANVTKVFSDALGALEAKGGPLRFDVDERAAVPPLIWQLELDESGLHINPQGSDLWRADLDPDLIRVRVETGEGSASDRAAVARLDPAGSDAALTLVRRELNDGSNETEMAYRVAPDALADVAKISALYRQGAGKYSLNALATNRSLPVYLPLREAVARRVEPNPDQPNHLCLPVTDGTLQLPVAGTREDAPACANLRDAFVGNFLFEFNGLEVEVDAARQADISVIWKAHIPGDINLVMGDPRGAMRRSLWSAEESPTPARLLPTGRRDPAFTRELVPVFGGLRKANAMLDLTGLGAWDIALEPGALVAGTFPVLWRAYPELPLISAMPMLADATASGPSELRALLPYPLIAALKLTSDGTKGLPGLKTLPAAAESPFNWPWPDVADTSAWGKVAVPLVSPSAPGLEYSLNDTDAWLAPNIAMRYDLPVLDELFAGARPPEQPAKTQSDTEQLEQITQGVFAPKDIDDLWRRRSIDLAMTRTQNVRATKWSTGFGDAVDGPLQLAEPFDANANVAFSTAYQLGDQQNGAPLGGYSIIWDGATTATYSGAAALLGIVGPDNTAQTLKLHDGKLHHGDHPDGTPVQITGFAPALYHPEPKASRLPTDSRGTGMANSVVRSGLDPNARDRATDFLIDHLDATRRKHLLHTLGAPIPIRMPGVDSALAFWARDLPLSSGDFIGKTNKHEATLGPSPGPFDRGQTSLSSYEWRFSARADKKTLRYDFVVGALRLRPVRLLHYKPFTKLVVLCRANLAIGNTTSQNDTEVFGDDHAYGGGALVALHFDYVAASVSDPAHFHFTEATRRVLNANATSLSDLRLAGTHRLEFRMAAIAETLLANEKVTSDLGDTGVDVTAKLSSAGSMLDDIKIAFTHFGTKVTLPGVTYADGEFSYETGNPGGPTDGIAITATTLGQTKPDTSHFFLTVRLAGGLPVSDATKAPPAFRATQDGLSWLGLTGIAVKAIAADHHRGVLHLRSDLPPTNSAPLIGLKFDTVEQPWFSAALVLVEHNTPGQWTIARALVQAEIAGTAGDARLGLRLNTDRKTAKRDAPQQTESIIKLDYRFEGTTQGFTESGITWDPDGVTVNGPDPKSVGHATLSAKKTAPWTHRLRATLDGHVIPTDMLAINNNGKVVLTQLVPLVLHVEHLLVSKTRRVTHIWTALESAGLCTGPMWLEDIGNDVNVHGPRYATLHSRYRGTTVHGVKVAGIGPRPDMLSGFDDARLSQAFMDAPETLLMLIGGGPAVQVAGAIARVFSLPWITAFPAGSKTTLPDALTGLMEFDDTRSWRAAGFDTSPKPLSSDSFARAQMTPYGTTSATQIDDLLARSAGVTPQPNLPTEVTRLIRRATEQGYVEAGDNSAGHADHKVWPLFLRSLLTLKHVLADGGPSRVLSLHPWVHNDKGTDTTGVSSFEFPRVTNRVERKSLAAVNLALPRFGLVALLPYAAPDLLPLENDAALADLSTLHDRIGVQRLRDIATGVMSGPDGAVLVELRPDGELRQAYGINLGRGIAEFGRHQSQLNDPVEEVYPSPALGWPEPTSVVGATRVAMRGKDDQPVISTTAGLAARSAALALEPRTFPKTASAHYIGTQARAVFHHGSSSEDMIFNAPAARHLGVLPPRLRTPVREYRQSAMDKAGAPKLADTVGLLPPGFSRSLIGERPGILETVIDGVLIDGETDPIDPGAPGFGRAGVIAPTLLRQVRTPRSPALPIEPKLDLAMRRRTYVSRADQTSTTDASGSDPAMTMRIQGHPAAMWRLADETAVQEDRLILELQDEVLSGELLQNALTSGEPIKLKLRILHGWWKEPPSDSNITGSQQPDAGQMMQALAKSGFLVKMADQSAPPLQAALAVGNTSARAQKLTWAKPDVVGRDSVLSMDIEFPNADAKALADLLIDPDPDARAELRLDFAGNTGATAFPADEGTLDLKDPDVLTEGEPRSIVLPLGRRARGRPSLDVASKTFLFADPAYDRVLATPARASNLLRIGNTSWILAADRVEYDASSTVFLAFGRLDPDTGLFADPKADYNLRFSFFPNVDGGGQEIPLQLASFLPDAPEDAYKARTNTPYAIPVSQLKAINNDDPLPEPGDRIKMAASVAGQTASIEFTLAASVKDPSPAAVYSVVRLNKVEATYAAPRTILHAAAPAPQRMEFVSLLDDLARGHVRRRAIFEWHYADIVLNGEPKQMATLIKTDRSGSAQLPEKQSDFSVIPKDKK